MRRRKRWGGREAAKAWEVGMTRLARRKREDETLQGGSKEEKVERHGGGDRGLMDGDDATLKNEMTCADGDGEHVGRKMSTSSKMDWDPKP